MSEAAPAAPAMANPELVSYVKAGYPLLYMVTPEENRAEFEIAKVANECQREISVWSHTEGLTNLTSHRKDDIKEPVAALLKLRDGHDGTIFVLRDMHAFFKNPPVTRHLRDIARDFKQKRKTVIMLSSVNQLPPELERDVVMVNFELPTKEQIEETWSRLHLTNKSIFDLKGVEITDDERDRIVQAALGLTSTEAENAFAKAIVISLRATPETRVPISKLVMKEKANAVKKSGILEYFEPKERKEDIGGLESLKKWLEIRSQAFSKKAREFGLPMPKGILLVGLPGCGKSLTAKAASNILNVPLIRFDISRVFGGIVGQSEQQMRGVMQTIDRVGQCVVWIDEAEKAFAGMGGSGNNDSGVTKRVFGNFLTWMQEKSGASFVVMTVNNIESIRVAAPEMLRKGRFDEIFFVGLPSQAEREVICEIHIRKNGRDPKKFNTVQLAKASSGFSGAELEQAVIEGLYAAFYEGSELQNKHILRAIENTNPLSKTQADVLEGMKRWAADNAVNASVNGKDEGHAGRSLEV